MEFGMPWGGEEPRDSAATRFVIDEARKMPEGEKLVVVCIGASTTLASALKLAPDIVPKIKACIMGFRYDAAKGVWNKSEFNVRRDLNAADYLLNCEGLELHVMDANVSEALKFDRDASFARQARMGDLGAYLTDKWQARFAEAKTWVMWDLALVQALLHPEWAQEREVETPPENRRRKVWVYTSIDVEKMQEDFWSSVSGDMAESKRVLGNSKPLPRLRVSENQRHLVTAEGAPFFWLGDTAWELFHRLNREEATLYLEDRASKGFTVIQAVALAELDGLNTPNAYGHRPLIENDPTRPDVKEGPENDYWDHVDFVVNKAGSLGLYMGFLPTWGDKWHKNGGTGPLVFTPENAEIYGRFLGERYRDHGLVWILGGDKLVGEGEERVLDAMARGLKQGDGGAHLMTFHPTGQYSSAIWFHDAPWLDFNMVQTGHTMDRDNYTSVAAEYQRTPVKPVLDGEPGYENIPHAFNSANPRLEAIHARRFCYWALFSGAFGHTYGCNDIWQMWQPGRKPVISAQLPWNEAIHLPGAGQMRHARALIESGPYFDRMPDPSLVAPPNGGGIDYKAACRAPDARYALVYFPVGNPAVIRTFLLKGPRLTAHWYDPRTGEHQPLPAVEVAPWKTTTFQPPQVDQDWVLILESEP
jgi:hypothetical protein